MPIETPTFAPLLDTQAVADLLGLTYNVILGMRKKGTGPKYFKTGRKYMYDLDAVVQWRKEKFSVAV